MKYIFRFSYFFKKVIKKIWILKEFPKIIFNYVFFPYFNKSQQTRVYYGGSFKRSIGGPAVKLKKLNRYFPEKNWSFNIIYLLSNSVFLPPFYIQFIKQKRLPIVLNQNGVFYPAWFDGNWEKENFKMSQIYHSADYVLWQSEFCKKASEKFLGKRIGRGEILHNAIDTSIFIPNRKLDNKKFTFLITGNIRKKSNYRILNVILALKEIIKRDKNIELVIAGNIEDKNYFYSKITDLKLQDYIIIQGTYSQKDAPKIYQNADAYITMSYQDNCPTAVLEAMSCGLPILYSKSGGIPELVDLNSGLGIEVEENWYKNKVPNKSSILEGMRKIIDNKSLMSDAARERAVRYFDLNIWIIKHKIIFEKLLEKN